MVSNFKQAKKLHPMLEIIVMTAYGTVEQAVEAMKEGAWDFIAKPIKRADPHLCGSKSTRKTSPQPRESGPSLRLRALDEAPQLDIPSPSMQRLAEEAQQLLIQKPMMILMKVHW